MTSSTADWPTPVPYPKLSEPQQEILQFLNDYLSRGLHQSDQLIDALLGEVGSRFLHAGPYTLNRIQLGA